MLPHSHHHPPCLLYIYTQIFHFYITHHFSCTFWSYIYDKETVEEFLNNIFHSHFTLLTPPAYKFVCYKILYISVSLSVSLCKHNLGSLERQIYKITRSWRVIKVHDLLHSTCFKCVLFVRLCLSFFVFVFVVVRTSILFSSLLFCFMLIICTFKEMQLISPFACLWDPIFCFCKFFRFQSNLNFNAGEVHFMNAKI